jgi:hypothetical protein
MSIVQDADLLSVQVKNGIAVDRWCKSVKVMIEKDTGIPAIHRLRIIHLYEADYNLFLKIQWGLRLIRHGEMHHGLNDQQFGSPKDRTAMDPVLLKQLSYDLSHQCHTSLATFNNDASAPSWLLLLYWRRDVFACHGMWSRHMQKLYI